MHSRGSLPDDLGVLLLDQEIIEVGACFETSRGREATAGEEKVHDIAAVEIDADGLDGRGGGGQELSGEEVAGLSACFCAQFGGVDAGSAGA